MLSFIFESPRTMRSDISKEDEELNEGSDHLIDMESEPILFNWEDRWLKGH